MDRAAVEIHAAQKMNPVTTHQSYNRITDMLRFSYYFAPAFLM
jgi:hypothetical protein